MRNQFVSAVPSLAQTGLLEGNINVVVDVGVVGRKVTLCVTQRSLAALAAQTDQIEHNFVPPVFQKSKSAFQNPAKSVFCRIPEKRFF
jgi:hypothetical protein